MKRCSLSLLLVVGLFFSGTGAITAAPLETLEGLVKQWVKLRSRSATEDQAWGRQQAQWEQEIALLRREETQLDTRIERAEQFEAATETRTSEQIARRDSLTAVLKQIDTVVDRMARDLQTLLPRIPVPLQSDELANICGQLTTDTAKTATARRVQLLISALTEIESLQHHHHSVRELLAIKGQPRREMDVVYLGLAQGFAVSPDNTLAAVGMPTANGWVWTPRQAIAPVVRNLVQIQNQDSPPALVTLPLNGQQTEVIKQP